MKVLIPLLAVGVVLYLLIRKAQAEPLAARYRETSTSPLGPQSASPPYPGTVETNPTRAKRNEFVDTCNGYIQAGATVASVAGPKGYAAGMAAKTGAPYACPLLGKATDLVSKTTGFSKPLSTAIIVGAPLTLPTIYAAKGVVKAAPYVGKAAKSTAGFAKSYAKKLCFFC